MIEKEYKIQNKNFVTSFGELYAICKNDKFKIKTLKEVCIEHQQEKDKQKCISITG